MTIKLLSYLFIINLIILGFESAATFNEAIAYHAQGCNKGNMVDSRDSYACGPPYVYHCTMQRRPKTTESDTYIKSEACAIPKPIQKGHQALLVNSPNSGSGAEVVAMACAPGTFTDVDAFSDDPRVSFCFGKVLCTGEGLEIFDYGPTTDSGGVECKCTRHYKRIQGSEKCNPDSERCLCERISCPEGTGLLNAHCRACKRGTWNSGQQLYCTTQRHYASTRDVPHTTTTQSHIVNTYKTDSPQETTELPNGRQVTHRNVAKLGAGGWIGITVGVVFVGVIIAIVWKKRQWLLDVNRRVQNLRHTLREAFCRQNVNPGQAPLGERPEVDASLLGDANSETEVKTEY